jgi:hypothetical protein
MSTMMIIMVDHDDDVGTISERKQLFSDELVNHCHYDVYLTTYDTLIIEEAFFTDSWPWVTVTIDEGHRIKNENAKLRLALSRLRCPFRLLLTGRWYRTCDEILSVSGCTMFPLMNIYYPTIMAVRNTL